MPDAIWVDQNAELAALGRALEAQPSIGVDTEFLRERTFFPKLCLLQLAADGKIWCVDTLHGGSLQSLVPALTAPQTRKILHAARQDLEAFYLTTRRVISPVFDTQIAAACVGLRPQVGYAELVKTLLHVTLPKGQTRTDWSKRPLTHDQLDYAADDVRYLAEIAARLTTRLAALGREPWAAEDCAALENPGLYEMDPSQAWERLRGLAQIGPAPRARAKSLAIWRERLARERDLPRAWIIPDAAIFAVAEANPAREPRFGALPAVPADLNDAFAESLLRTLQETAGLPVTDLLPGQELRPTPEQKVTIERLARLVDARAAELEVGAELLAPRGELKALALGRRNSPVLSGWRRGEIGTRLLESL